MTAPVYRAAGQQRSSVETWQVCATPPGAFDDPGAVARASLPWITAPAPTTAAAALRAAGAFSLDGPARRFDAEDWWFRAALPEVEPAGAVERALVLEGIATVADVWLDGAHLLSSDNMFRRHERPLPANVRAGAELVIRCRALDALLAARRPRPRWRAPMIENQQIRWFRTTLLGRTPGWSPPAAAVGPWRDVCVEQRAGAVVDDLRVASEVHGTRGRVDLSCRIRVPGRSIERAELVVSRDGAEWRASLARRGETFAGAVEIPDIARWWPHTHGEPALYATRLVVDDHHVELGAIGFRELAREEPFALRVNGARIFCRGACWTPIDVVSLAADRAAIEAALTQARDAGMNMLRVGGTMVYESDDFYDLCDRLGILVWQDFMFANMDYPEDEAFVAGAVEEATQLLDRLQGRPSLAVLCGNSEGEQQAAMWGAPRERWAQALFSDRLADVARARRPDVPYWPSSAHGGAFPHQPNEGTTSYYGVGAYLRPIEDARRAEVRFASECLAFANVPAPAALPGGPSARVHHPAWKARTPRDLGAGWDFDDVRDHYLARLFRVDPVDLRSVDHDRYLELGRVVTGEVMERVFGEWRRARSTCGGGLVWFLRDLWAGAGWGVVDAAGAPKAAWYYLRRAFRPLALHVSDEGDNGLALHVCNDRPERFRGRLELALYRAGEVSVGRGELAVDVGAHAQLELPAAAAFEGFLDLSYAYRFGPAPYDVLAATLRRSDAPAGEVAASAFHFPVGLPAGRELDVGLAAEATVDGASARLTLRTRRFAQSVAIDCEGFAPEDAFFHLAPGEERMVRLSRTSNAAVLKGSVKALNSEATTRIVVATR